MKWPSQGKDGTFQGRGLVIIEEGYSAPAE